MPNLQIPASTRQERMRGWSVAGGATLAVALIASGMIHEWRQQAAGVVYGPMAVTNSVAQPGAFHQAAQVVNATATSAPGTYSSSVSAGSAATSGVAFAPKAAAVSAVGTGRKIVENASLQVRATHVGAAFQTLQAMVASAGGFVQNSQESGAADQTVWLTARVPAANFPSFLAHARKLGHVLSFSQSGQDVTQQDQNLTANIAELKQEAVAYARLFSRAQTMKDMLAVEQALVQVNSQLTDLQQQSAGLAREVAFATVQVMLTHPQAGPIRPSPVTSAWRQFVDQTGASALAVVDLIAWVLPWAIVLAAVGFGTRILLRRRTH